MSPQVSVIMSVFNGESFVKEAIESILNQTFSDFEFIIINDGSSDGSEKIIQNFKDERIRYIKNHTNVGLIASLNKGLELATGKYIARMDDDDISLPERFEKQVKFLEEYLNVAIVATKLVIINERGYEIDYWPEDYRITTASEIKETLPVINCIGHPTVMMRAALVKKIKYSKNLKRSEDWGLWLDVLSKGYGIAKLNEVLVKYRVHAKSTTVKANAAGIEKKVISFKTKYLGGKIVTGRLKGTDYKVLKSLCRDIAKFFLKPILSPIIHILKINWIIFFRQFAKAKRSLRNDSIPLIFIFPYYHMGGAEKVHASIIEAAANKEAIVLITGDSTNRMFFDKMNLFSQVLEVNLLLKMGFSKRWLISRMISLQKKQKQMILFGCNSPFFYELVPQMPEARSIDLIHAFVHMNESGPEKWSLNIVSSLASRVVINKKTLKDFEQLYNAHAIDIAYLSRIKFIPNFVETESKPVKDYKSKLRVLYAGRGSQEKRVHLIIKAAHELKNRGVDIEFHFAGDLEEAIPGYLQNGCMFHGVVTEKEIKKLYCDSHILIMASSREGFPMVIMEAMMCGTVPVTTNVGGISEHIIDGNTGILINSLNEDKIIDDFVNSLIFYNSNREALEKLSLNAYHYAIQNFNKENFFNSYRNLLSTGK
jgi:glycosyltransferase involved in cell wall biosynthesis